MKLTIGAATDSGRRPNNEDYYAIVNVDKYSLTADAVVIVADGMGGRNFGEKASEAAVDTVAETLQEMLTHEKSTKVNTLTAIESALRRANDKVFELSQENEEAEGMGTTCVAAVITDGRLFVGHAGDSRAYVVRYGRLEQLTDDHSYVAEQVRAGRISEEGARKSKFRNVITRAVGIESDINPEISEYSLEGIDAILLCTDGLTNMVRDKDIEKIVVTASSPQMAAEKLIRQANRNGGADNITAVIVRIGDGPIVEPLEPAAQEQMDADLEGGAYPHLRTAPSWLYSLLIVIFFSTTIFFSILLTQAGYTWKMQPPFLFKPIAVDKPRLDLKRADYEDPVTIGYPYPVQSEPLIINPSTGSISVVSSGGESVVSMRPNGSTSYKIAWSHLAGSAVNKIYPAGKASNWHMTTDVQGNIYVADANAGVIRKYSANGDLIKTIGDSKLTRPQSIAVDETGNIYVIDNNFIKVIRSNQ